jgi:hypothetical protein
LHQNVFFNCSERIIWEEDIFSEEILKGQEGIFYVFPGAEARGA